MDRGAIRCADGLVPGELSALARYRAELNERLVVHLAGGAWRVPLATRHLAVQAADGALLGRIVCGGPADAGRAVAALGRAPAAPDPARLAAILAPWAGLLGDLATLEGTGAEAPPLAVPEGGGPVLLAPPGRLAPGALLAALAAAAPRGVVWVPDPRTAASSHLIARALAPVFGPALALIQGDGATRAALAAAGLSPAA